MESGHSGVRIEFAVHALQHLAINIGLRIILDVDLASSLTEHFIFPVIIWWYLWIISHISKAHFNKICARQQHLWAAMRVVWQLAHTQKRGPSRALELTTHHWQSRLALLLGPAVWEARPADLRRSGPLPPLVGWHAHALPARPRRDFAGD
jgi:hypothetical protein